MVSPGNKKNCPSVIIRYPFLSRALLLHVLLCHTLEREVRFSETSTRQLQRQNSGEEGIL